MPVIDREAMELVQSCPAGWASEVSDGEWEPWAHLCKISEWIVDAAMGRRNRVIIEVPPGFGKSTLISGYGPSWFLGSFPKKRVLLTSHEADLATHWGAMARDTLAEFGPRYFGVGVDPERSPKHWWHVVDALTGKPTGGYMASAGVGGSITGKRADLFIVDDPLKDAESAHSPKTRKAHKDWIRSVMRSRLRPGGAVIILMTRWHQDDMAGWLQGLDLKTVKWDVLRMPALAEENDPLGRKPGTTLCPQLFSTEELISAQEEVGSYWWNAQWMQRPGNPKGTVFKQDDFRYFDEVELQGVKQYRLLDALGQTIEYVPAARCRVFATMDLAISEKETADWTVLSTWAITPRKQLLLLEVRRERVSNHQPMLSAAYTKWRHAQVQIEGNQFQVLVSNAGLSHGIPCRPVQPKGDKYARALTAQPLLEGHKVFFRHSAAWLEAWEDELKQFPRAKNDDQVDTLSYAAIALLGQPRPRVSAA